MGWSTALPSAFGRSWGSSLDFEVDKSITWKTQNSLNQELFCLIAGDPGDKLQLLNLLLLQLLKMIVQVFCLLFLGE